MDGDIARARALLEAGRPAEARSVLSRVLASEPDAIEPLILMAGACHALDDHHALLAMSERLIALLPGEEIGHRFRSLACTGLDRDVEAVRDAREAVRLGPLEYRTHLTLASALCGVRDGHLRGSLLDEAWQAAMRAVELAPDEADSHVQTGIVAYFQRRPEVSELALRRALDIDPEHVGAMNMLGMLRLRGSDEHQAGGHFRAALNADPTSRFAVDHGLAGVARVLLRRLLILVSVVLLPVLLLLESTAPYGLRVAVTAVVAAGAGGVLTWSLRRLEPSVRDWVLTSPRRDRSVGLRTVTTTAALAGVTLAGLTPVSLAEPVLIYAVLSVGVAWWVHIVF